MFRVKEVMLDKATVSVEVDGILDEGAVPVLTGVCERHINQHKNVLLDLEGLLHVTREGMVFLQEIRERVGITHLPEFVKLEGKVP